MFRGKIDTLLLFVPLAVGLKFLAPDQEVFIFISSCLAIIPLAGWLGEATEHIAERTSEGLGGLLNATFGNAAELIIALMALHAGLTDVVKASLTGSIIGNILLVLGASFVAGGFKHQTQTFNQAGAQTQSTMLILACIGLVAPTMYYQLSVAEHQPADNTLSLEVSLILLVTYFLSLLFSLKTHKHLFSGAATETARAKHEKAPVEESWSIRRSVATLLISTAFVAWMSEILVGSVEHTAHALGMSNLFIGVIVVAVVGNAAEHSTAILVAMKNRMDLSLGIAIGSSIQIAVFVAPVLVIASYFIGPRPMDLVFHMSELIAILLSVMVCAQASNDGKSNWFEGAQLLSVYLIWAVMFYFIPVAAPSH